MLVQHICAIARDHPAKPAIVHSGIATDYSQFAQALNAACLDLEKYELPAGHTVVVMVQNLRDCWVIVLALQALGLNTVCVASHEVIDVLGLNKSAGIVTTASDTPPQPVNADARTAASIITTPTPTYQSGDVSRLPGFTAHESTGGHLLYTSGTTGTYKKLLLSADLTQKFATEWQETGIYTAGTRYHCLNFGLWTGAGYKPAPAVWYAGGCVIFDQRPDWHQHFLHSGMTHAILIPDAVEQLLNSPGIYPESSPGDFELTLTAGFTSPKRAGQLLAHVTTNLVVGYGCSELNGYVLTARVTNPEDLQWLTCTDGREVEVVDESENLCPVDTEGFLRVRLDALDPRSYLDEPEVTAQMFRAGYFYPGDMAIRRADGRIRILGRSADVINLRGQKIAVAPMEESIRNLLGVTACLFAGVNDTGEDEVVIALESKEWPELSHMNHLGREFDQYGQVRFAKISRFPRVKTGTGKIDRTRLRNMVCPTR